MRERAAVRLAVLALLGVLMTGLVGCGPRLVVTRGFRSHEVLRIGTESVSETELRIMMMDLTQQTQEMFGEKVWERDQDGELSDAVREKALSEVSRIKVLDEMSYQGETQLTNAERESAQKAADAYYAALSKDQKSQSGATQKTVRKLFASYVLAQKVVESGDADFEKKYSAFQESLDSDLNAALLEKIHVKAVQVDEGSLTIEEALERFG